MDRNYVVILLRQHPSHAIRVSGAQAQVSHLAPAFFPLVLDAPALAQARVGIAMGTGTLFFAFVYNTLGIPITAGVLYPIFDLLLNPIIASTAMSLSSDRQRTKVAESEPLK